VVNAKTRTYYVQLPANYSSATPYPVVFQFHPSGGTAEQAMTIYNLRSQMPEAIYVSPQGLSGNWANSGGEDIELTKTILATVQASYCVNNARVFSVGFSYGAMMSFAIGCELGGTFRAIAPMSGALYSGCKAGDKPIAMWGTHGLSDTIVPVADGRKARDAILSRNHCGTTIVNTSPSPCMSYQGCDSGYPVTWCEFDGSHSMPSWASSAIVAFFGQLP